MQLNGYQIYVRCESLDQVLDAVSQYVEDSGCDAYLDIHSDSPSSVMGKRNQRTFTVSIPKDGYISVWEDGSWADKRLALYMSEELKTEVIWLMFSNVTDSWGFIKYSEGRHTDWYAETSSNCLNRAKKFVEQNRLPFALLYFPDPNATDPLAIPDGVSAEGETGEELDSENVEVEWIEEIEWQEVDEAFEDEKLPTPDQDLAADISRFVEVTLPCKGSH